MVSLNKIDTFVNNSKCCCRTVAPLPLEGGVSVGSPPRDSTLTLEGDVIPDNDLDLRPQMTPRHRMQKVKKFQKICQTPEAPRT